MTDGKRRACPTMENGNPSFIKIKPRGKLHGLPHSLRRHYPHQVQGVSGKFTGLSATRLPRICLFQNRTALNEVNAGNNCKAYLRAAQRKKWRLTQPPYDSGA